MSKNKRVIMFGDVRMTVDKFQKEILKTYTITPQLLINKPTFMERIFPSLYYKRIKTLSNGLVEHAQKMAKLAVIDYIDSKLE